MFWFYIGALLPVAIGAALFARSHRVNWIEWLTGSAAAFVMAGVFHWIAVAGITSDVQTYSGQIAKATHHPEWVEEYTYQVAHTTTDSDGNTSTYYTTHTGYRTHPEFWDADTNIGTNHGISREDFQEIRKAFRCYDVRAGNKSGFYSGDPSVYVAENKTGHIFPATARGRWENRIKAAPSVFSFSAVPSGVKVFKWPENPNWRCSERLLGTAALMIDIEAFDKMCARLGPKKKVNVILIGWGKESADIANWQESAWVGGKKNDLVLCVGGAMKGQAPKWARVFGWTESALVKRNLESILLSQPLSDTILTKIEAEIVRNYTLKDWTKFDYIAIEPPAWAIVVYFGVMICVHGGFWFWAVVNEHDKI